MKADVAGGEGIYSARSCPNCLAEVTFWAALKQYTPFRFKCPHCKESYRIHTPRMALMFCAVICGTILYALGICIGVLIFGSLVLLAAVPLFMAAWIALEIWSHQYIKCHGNLTHIYTGEQEIERRPKAQLKS